LAGTSVEAKESSLQVIIPIVTFLVLIISLCR
jgi:hypothetical protein